jgi:lactoylglutathione lyase
MKFAYTILYVADVARSLEHYETAFGLSRRFLHESGTYGEMETGATTLSFASLELGAMNFSDGVEPADLRKRPMACEIAFSTSDVKSAFDLATSSGATPVSPPTSKPWGQIVAYVRDIDGHLVELCTPMS